MMNFFQRDIWILPQLLFAFRAYIDSIYGKGSRDKDNNDYSLELRFNMILNLRSGYQIRL